MTVFNPACVAFVAISLNGLFLALAVVYRRQLRQALRRVERLRAELNASHAWNGELRAAKSAVDQLVSSDPMHLAAQLPQRDDPLEQMFRAPAIVPDHERGQR